MMKLKLALVTAIVVATTSMAAAQTYILEAPWYVYSNMDHADAAGSPPGQHRNPGENGGG